MKKFLWEKKKMHDRDASHHLWAPLLFRGLWRM